jgi:Ca2+-binding RTX toxin-like protein
VTYYGVEKFDVSLGLGNDALQTGDADDRVLGGGGNDYLRTGGGADVVDGGAGYDRWQADKSAATAALVINLNVASAYKVGSVTGSVQGIEVLGAGDAVADRFFTGSGNDVITTLSNFDRDYLDTGAGDDRIVFLAGSDVARMGDGFDTLVIDWSTLGSYDTTFGSFAGTLAAGYDGLINNGANNDAQNRVSYYGVEKFDVSLGLGNDALQTGDADDRVLGGGGNDYLRTGGGADVVDGGAGYDRWQADKSAATADIRIDLGVLSNYMVAGVRGSVQGIEVLGAGDAAADRFFTGSGNDTITTLANFDRDFLDTGAGNDRVVLLAGSDVVRMGAGFDTLVVDWSAASGYDTTFGDFAGSLGGGYDGLINNGANNDGQNRVYYYGVEKFDVSLGAGNDSLFTGDGDDRVSGGAGDDYLRTGGGADIIDGGAGFDRWVADKSAATADLLLDINATSTYTVGAVAGSVKAIEALGAGDAIGDRFVTGSGNDAITTRALFTRDFLDTGAGNDKVTLLAGADVVRLGIGFDTLVVNWSGAGGYDTTFGGLLGSLAAGYDGQINNGANNDGQNRVTFFGVEKFQVALGEGNDQLQTGDGDDTVSGGGGGDYLRTGGGADIVDGGAGYDRWQADKSAATANLTINLNVASTYKVGSVTGSVQGIEVLGAGDSAADRFITGSGNDTITTLANFDRDFLETGAGNDRVVFFAGSDVARMGDGLDTLVVDWSAASGYETTFAAFSGDLATGYEGVINNGANNDGQNRVTYSGVERFEVSLGAGNDGLQTGDGDDTVSGGNGDDYLRTGGGADNIDGGDGFDRWQADKSSATADLAINLTKSSNYTVGGVTARVKNIEALGGGDGVNDRFMTGSGNDTITTRALFKSDFLDTGAGDDRAIVLGGSDVVRMGAGLDTLVVDWSGATGFDTTFGGFAGDLASGYDGLINNGANNDGQNRVAFYAVERFEVSLGEGNDSLQTGDGDDIVSGGAGGDYLRTGGGADTVDGGDGIDRWQADKSAATANLVINLAVLSAYEVAGKAGSVQGIEALGGSDADGDRFVTGTGNDVVTTGTGFLRDIIDSGAGNDTVKLLNGSDIARMGEGDDLLVIDWSGATGFDTYAGIGAGTLAAGYDGLFNNGANNDGQNRAFFFGVERFDASLGEGNDSLQTGDGADRLIGNGGGDTLLAGGGNDFLRGGAGNDTLDGGDGIDTADYSDKSDAVSVTLNGATNATVLVGGVAEDVVRNIENLRGGTGDDNLTGDGLDNQLAGGLGNDVLTGSGGHDRFLFDTVLNKNTNVDTLASFDVAEDTIVLDRTIFAAFANAGALDASAFTIGTGPTAADHRIVYNAATGDLFYDRNGDVSGGTTKFAQLDSGLALTNNNFQIV